MLTLTDLDHSTSMFFASCHLSANCVRRIENCLQRYRARRKLDEYKANVLTKYFMLGGVDSTKKAFTGGELDSETLENCTAKEIEALKAQDYIRPSWGVKNPKFYDGSSDWVVDFEGVAKGFL